MDRGEDFPLIRCMVIPKRGSSNKAGHTRVVDGSAGCCVLVEMSSSWNVCMPNRKINTEVQAETMNMPLENI
jgi:hypothetical protein